MKRIIINIIATIILCFAALGETNAQDKSNTMGKEQAISLALNDYLDIEYRRMISQNWYFTVNAILSQKLKKEFGDVPVGENLVNLFTLGAKLSILYHKNIFSPISINFGGGIVYTRNEYYVEYIPDKETNKTDSFSDIEIQYGFSFLSDLEISVYKSFSLFARFNVFAGLKNYSSRRSYIDYKYYYELENVSVGMVIYW